MPSTTEICKILIEKIKEKDPVDPWASDITALHTAVSSRNLEICKILIKHADNPNPADDIYADTALHDAAVNGDIDIFKLIMEHSGESNPSNRRGQTALHHAARHGNLEICKLIVQNAGNINEPDHNNQTPLHYAFECNKEGMLFFKFKSSLIRQSKVSRKFQTIVYIFTVAGLVSLTFNCNLINNADGILTRIDVS